MDIDVKCEQPAGTPSFSALDAGMALRAERDKVLFGVVARVAAELPVVHLEVRHRAARCLPTRTSQLWKYEFAQERRA